MIQKQGWMRSFSRPVLWGGCAFAALVSGCDGSDSGSSDGDAFASPETTLDTTAISETVQDAQPAADATEVCGGMRCVVVDDVICPCDFLAFEPRTVVIKQYWESEFHYYTTVVITDAQQSPTVCRMTDTMPPAVEARAVTVSLVGHIDQCGDGTFPWPEAIKYEAYDAMGRLYESFDADVVAGEPIVRNSQCELTIEARFPTGTWLRTLPLGPMRGENRLCTDFAFRP